MKSVPEIRFPGFTDLWELRKVGEFAVESCEKGHNGQEALKLTVKLHTKGVCKMEEKGQGSDNTQYYVRHAGQLIYGKQNFFNGAIGIVPQSLDGYESTKDVPAFDIDDNVCVEWFYQYIARPGIYKSQEVNCTGTGSKRFHVNAFFDMNIPIPLIEEQKKISDYFKAIDNLITLQEQRCQVLKRLKQCMLQKMFPKDGSDTPEIRFPGFTGSWEQRKLGDVVEIGSGMDYKHLNEGNIPVYGTGGYMLSVDKALSENKDAIGIGRKGTIDKPYILKAPFWTVDTLFYCIPKDNYDLDFTNCLFQNIDWKKKDESTGVPSLSKVIINSVETFIPSYAEQKKIGEYFLPVDHLITLQERKCKVLRELKKCMLQKMFV